jgi:hypothetical protein
MIHRIEHLEIVNGPLDLAANVIDEVVLAEIGVVAPNLDDRFTSTNPAFHFSSSRDNRSQLDDVLIADRVVGSKQLSLTDRQIGLGNQLESPEEIRNPAHPREIHFAPGVAKNHLHWNNDIAAAARARTMAITTTQAIT